MAPATVETVCFFHETIIQQSIRCGPGYADSHAATLWWKVRFGIPKGLSRKNDIET